MLISMLVLTTSTTVFGASNLTELNEEFPGASDILNLHTDTPYYIFYTIGNTKGIWLFSKEVKCDFSHWESPDRVCATDFSIYCDEKFIQKSFSLQSDGTFKHHATNTIDANTLLYSTDGYKPWTKEEVQYCNFDIKDKNGTTFFEVARYPLTTIKGQISSKTITKLTLMEIKTLIVFLMGFLILALAFRKAWVMLKTILSVA